ncbi:MAG TPA: hypothetical protein DHW82_13295 [Spirochaetia bacterium]|nr:MAG: hypothetical protein A2Y41_11510 [Spirochaetes bacterium GWB1_36_13]HCL57965.1 hypothetical protein [Spirochaetia bacterium]
MKKTKWALLLIVFLGASVLSAGNQKKIPAKNPKTNPSGKTVEVKKIPEKNPKGKTIEQPLVSKTVLQNSVLYLYGTPDNDMTYKVMDELKRLNIDFVFFDVFKLKAKKEEMIKLLKNKGLSTEYFDYPVVVYNSNILRPEKETHFNKLEGFLLTRFTADIQALMKSNPETQFKTDTLYIYGTTSCGRTLGVTRKLTEDKIAYIFYDVSKDTGKRKEMFNLLKSKGMGNSAKYPVVSYNEAVIQPDQNIHFKGKVFVLLKFLEDVNQIMNTKK